MMIDLGKLRLFYIVAQEGSVSKAAQRLNTSQPALSEHIINFEHRLKVKLFKRTARGMMLTPEGQRLFQHAKNIVTENEAFEKEFYGKETLKIVTTSFLGTEWLIESLNDFLNQHDDLRLKIHLTDESLHTIKGDVYICTLIPQKPQLVQEFLYTVQIGLYAHEDYLKRFGTPQTIEDLDEHRLITFDDTSYTFYGSQNWILHVGKEHNERPRGSYIEVNALRGMFNCALQGYGIVELPDTKVILSSGLKRVLPQIQGPEIPIYYSFPKSRADSRKIYQLLEHLKKKEK